MAKKENVAQGKPRAAKIKILRNKYSPGGWEAYPYGDSEVEERYGPQYTGTLSIEGDEDYAYSNRWYQAAVEVIEALSEDGLHDMAIEFNIIDRSIDGTVFEVEYTAQ